MERNRSSKKKIKLTNTTYKHTVFEINKTQWNCPKRHLTLCANTRSPWLRERVRKVTKIEAMNSNNNKKQSNQIDSKQNVRASQLKKNSIIGTTSCYCIRAESKRSLNIWLNLIECIRRMLKMNSIYTAKNNVSNCHSAATHSLYMFTFTKNQETNQPFSLTLEPSPKIWTWK